MDFKIQTKELMDSFVVKLKHILSISIMLAKLKDGYEQIAAIFEETARNERTC